MTITWTGVLGRLGRTARDERAFKNKLGRSVGSLVALSCVIALGGCGDDELDTGSGSDVGFVSDVAVGDTGSDAGCTSATDCAGLSVGECEAAVCQQGQCVAVPKAVGTTCPAGTDPCFPTSVCDGLGVCTAKPLDCNDNDACTTDSCAAGTGCVNTPIADCGSECVQDGDCAPIALPECKRQVCNAGKCEQAAAFDGSNCDASVASDPCAAGGVCQSGECEPVAVECDDGLDCTVDSCDPVDGCQHEPDGPNCLPKACEVEADCADLDLGVCKKGSCIDKKCVAVPAADGNACADEAWATNPCIEGGACKEGSCTPNQKNCDDAIDCTEDACNPETGACQHVPTGDDCVVECEDDSGCQDGEYCSDGLVPGIGKKVCAPLKEDGVACFDDGQCASGKCGGCVDVGSIEAGWCYTESSKVLEQPCKANNECVSGACTALCPVNLTGVCECTAQADCPEGFVCDKGILGNVCVEKPDALAVGEACEKNDDCGSGQCEGDVCVCDVDSDCDDGFYCNAIIGIANTCEPIKAECDTCVLDKECGPDAICLALGFPVGTPKCIIEDSKAIGDDCCKNAQCASNNCDDGKCAE